MTRRLTRGIPPLAGAVALLACAPGVATAGTPLPPPHPTTGFTTRIDNPWFPLKPGTTLTYRGVKDGKAERDVFRVTRQARVIDGIRCRVIDDRVYARGHLSERTHDYYSQDARGDVWYFGEDTAELDSKGHVISREGTWHTGVNGARAGIFMPAHPRVGRGGYQEYLKGHAEDRFRVSSLRAIINVPFGTFRQALRTTERTRLEPGVVDAKFYVRGIGEVFEGSVKGPKETFRLVTVHHSHR
jgi:hypothetical protein